VRVKLAVLRGRVESARRDCDGGRVSARRRGEPGVLRLCQPFIRTTFVPSIRTAFHTVVHTRARARMTAPDSHSGRQEAPARPALGDLVRTRREAAR
jgi:hypothetical protein